LPLETELEKGVASSFGSGKLARLGEAELVARSTVELQEVSVWLPKKSAIVELGRTWFAAAWSHPFRIKMDLLKIGVVLLGGTGNESMDVFPNTSARFRVTEAPDLPEPTPAVAL